MLVYYVYILTNKGNRAFYVGFSSDLVNRVWKHKNKTYDGFTAKYNINKLVYFESTSDVKEAIEREKRLKKWPREYKIKLITKFNPGWKDLFDDFV